MRVREFYGYALIAGIGHEEAENTTPGYIMDMYVIRMRHDAQMAGVRMPGRLLGGGGG